MYLPVTLIATAVFAFLSAPDSQQAPVYKVEFTLSNGAAGNPQPSQRYSMLVDESRKAVFQAMNGVPTGCNSPRFIDTGANIELALHTSEGKVAIEGVIDLTSITGQVNLSSLCEPIIGQRKIAFHTMLEPGKPATLDDDPHAGPTRHVEAVVTKVN